MTSRIDPIRRARLLRRAAETGPEEVQAAASSAVIRLPAPVERASRSPPRDRRGEGQAAFAAQLIGQEGQKRGLRAGPELADAAKRLYNRTEWSGSKDRRSRKGGKTRAEV